jgi:FkbM family methyltransferase
MAALRNYRIAAAVRRMAVGALVTLLRALQTEQTDPSDVYYCYRLLLGRRPDPQGWESWLHAVRRGVLRKDVVEDFLSSPEYRKKTESSVVCVATQYGFSMFVDAADYYIGREITASANYEPHVTTVLLRELQEDHVFLDIGANMGWFTLLAAQIVRKGKVIAVEPNYSNIQLLYRSVLDNGFENVQVHPYAATDVPAILRVNAVHSNAVVAEAAQTHEESGAESYTMLVQGVPLDDLLQHEARIDVVKIDVEGHEPRVLQGMQMLIRRHRPVIFSEFHPKAMQDYFGLDGTDYVRALLRLDYRLAAIERDGSERSFADVEEVMAHWQVCNRMAGLTDELHLDLVARPV